MLRLMHAEGIADLLLELPGLIGQQERRSTDFVRNAVAWLTALEDLFTASRLHQAGSIAILRSGLLSAEHGHVPEGLQFRGRPTRTRVLTALAAQALKQAADTASELLSENRARLAEAERVAQQIVAAGLSRGVIMGRGEEASNTEFLRALRRGLSTSADLEPAAVHLEGLVGPYDALILFDRALAPHLAVLAVAMTGQMQ
nr:hypothetical protein [uncultured Dongia sp.]